MKRKIIKILKCISWISIAMVVIFPFANIYLQNDKLVGTGICISFAVSVLCICIADLLSDQNKNKKEKLK